VIQPVARDGSLLHAFIEARRSTSLLIWWIGQSGFVCVSSDREVVFDPYLSDSLTAKYAGTDKPHVRMSELAMKPTLLRASGPTLVTATHQHTDHMDAETLNALLRDHALTKMIAPTAWRPLAAERSGLDESQILSLDASESVTVEGVEITAVPAAHDGLDRDANGHHLYLGYVARLAGWKIYHSGDTVVYPGMVDRLRPMQIDVALLPINGKVGNMNGIDAAHLAKEIGAKVIIPCHYDMFEFNTADPYEQFVPECERIGQAYRVLKLGERFTYP
jgi:L-ascorbate metabolism protein UlaG (beta-lactamase superfamily)